MEVQEVNPVNYVKCSQPLHQALLYKSDDGYREQALPWRVLPLVIVLWQIKICVCALETNIVKQRESGRESNISLFII